MPVRFPRSPAFLSAALALPTLAFLFDSPRAQPGTVLVSTKVSDTEGGFLEPLGDTDEFGGAVASLGDLDGPGGSVTAVAAGAVGDDDGGTNRGATYVLFLDPGGTVLSSRKISDTQGGFTEPLGNADEFGSSLAALGDLDGAGPSAAALAVGAVGDDDGGTNRGAVFILFLDTTGNVLSHTKISDTQGGFTEPLGNGDEFGGAVAFLGDLDGAGPAAAALAVGAIGDDDGGTDRGAVYILFLDDAGGVLSHLKIAHTQGGFGATLDDVDEFGSSVTWLGDLDGGGPSAAAIAVGAVGDDDGGSNRGAVHILFLDATGSVLSHGKISDTAGGFPGGLANDDEFGGAVAAAGDLDGPGGGARTLAVTASLADDGGVDRGATWILFLDAAGGVVAHQKISHSSGNLGAALDDEDQFGSSVASLGDIDGGSAAGALVVGAVGDDDGGPDRGAVYVLFLDGVTTSDVAGLPAAAATGSLGRAAPNPFRPATAIPFSLDRPARVRIDVCDVSGRLVRRLVDEPRGAGPHRVGWDGRDGAGRRLPAGTYFFRMTIDGRTLIGGGKVSLLR